MISISKYSIPTEIMTLVLLEASDDFPSSLVYRRVCKGFKIVADSPLLLHSLLIKVKGGQYEDLLYRVNPKNFFVLEKDLVRSIQKNAKLGSISSIALKSLSFGSFLLSNGHYFRLSSPQNTILRNVSCMNQNNWNACIEAITGELANWDSKNQVIYTAKGELRLIYQKIEHAYHNPNTIMEGLIQKHAIKNMYFVESDVFIIHTENKWFNPALLQEAFLEPEEFKKKTRLTEFTGLLHSLIPVVHPQNPNQIAFSLNCTSSKHQEFVNQLADKANPLKAELEKIYTHDYYRFLLGYLFPRIWPNNFEELGAEKRRNAGLYWAIHYFRESLGEIISTETGSSVTKYNPILYKYLYISFQNPELRLKELIDHLSKTSPKFDILKAIFAQFWK